MAINNPMFGDDYGIIIATGTFGAGKTKNLFQDCWKRKQNNPEGILIANVPYDFVDIKFSHKEDLNEILSYLRRYIEDTNGIDNLKKQKEFIPIRVVIDEAHLYYYARDFAKMDKDILLIMTQCRKRKIRIDFITQELSQLDKFLRTLCPYVLMYKKILFGFKTQTMYYFKVTESTDIGDEVNVEEIERERLLPDSWTLFFTPKLQEYYDQKYLTLFVIGIDKLVSGVLDYPGFMSVINEKQAISDEKEEKRILKKKIKKNKSLWKSPKYQNEIVELMKDEKFIALVEDYKQQLPPPEIEVLNTSGQETAKD